MSFKPFKSFKPPDQGRGPFKSLKLGDSFHVFQAFQTFQRFQMFDTRFAALRMSAKFGVVHGLTLFASK